MQRPKLKWEPVVMEDGQELRDCWDAFLGDFEGGDGVRFHLSFQPTCYRRGPWKLQINIAHGPHHYEWGCFDGADQPLRYYHNERCVRIEVESLADVLWTDRYKEG